MIKMIGYVVAFVVATAAATAAAEALLRAAEYEDCQKWQSWEEAGQPGFRVPAWCRDQGYIK